MERLKKRIGLILIFILVIFAFLVQPFENKEVDIEPDKELDYIEVQPLIVDVITGGCGIDIEKEISHIVQKGESLWSLANQYGTTSNIIQAANSMSNNVIITGQEVIIPKRIYYITKYNLRRHAESMDDLLDAIYIAEGGSRARVPYGATSFHDSGNKGFSNARMQYLFVNLNPYGTQAGSKEYYKIVTYATILFYWEIYMIYNENIKGKYFDEVSSDIQFSFIEFLGSYYAPTYASPLNKNWVNNVLYYFSK